MSDIFRIILMSASLLMPWALRRWVLSTFFGYKIHPTCRIGLAWVLPKTLIMERNSAIAHFTVCKNLELVHLHEHSYIGKGNWITGYPLGQGKFFASETDRFPQLILGEHAAITHRHIIDCTSSVTIGKYSILAGFNSQVLTHSIDLQDCRQASQPIAIGKYCFVGTSSILLGGSALPDYSVLGAGSLLNKKHTDSHCLYAGSPSRPVKTLPDNWKFFTRADGFVR